MPAPRTAVRTHGAYTECGYDPRVVWLVTLVAQGGLLVGIGPGADADLCRATEDAFRESSGIVVVLRPLAELGGISGLGAEGAPAVLWMVGERTLREAAGDGHLVPYAVSAGVSSPAGDLADVRGRWRAVAVHPVVLAASKGAAEAPGDWRELSEPPWRGALILDDGTAAASPTATVVTTLLAAVPADGAATRLPAADWLRGLDRNTAAVFESPEDVLGTLAAADEARFAPVDGESWARFLSTGLDGELSASVPEPGSPWRLSGVALVRGGGMDLAATTFHDWALGAAARMLLSDHGVLPAPLRIDDGIPPPAWWARAGGAPGEESLVGGDRERAFERGEAWMALWRQGVVGRGRWTEAAWDAVDFLLLIAGSLALVLLLARARRL